MFMAAALSRDWLGEVTDRQIIGTSATNVVLNCKFDIRPLFDLCNSTCESQEISMADVLLRTRTRMASNLRDHVYGVNGLICHPDLVPDYTISAKSSFRHIAQYIMERDRSLDILFASMHLQAQDHFGYRSACQRRHRLLRSRRQAGKELSPLGRSPMPTVGPLKSLEALGKFKASYQKEGLEPFLRPSWVPDRSSRL